MVMPGRYEMATINNIEYTCGGMFFKFFSVFSGAGLLEGIGSSVVDGVSRLSIGTLLRTW
jgi:hypothetical protein